MQLSHRVFMMGSVVLLALSLAGYFAWKAHETNRVQPESEEVEMLVQEISTLAYLPEGEVPTLATVTNRDKLDNQPFFRGAQNGDKILIYPRAGWAVLYRPSSQKVLAMTEVDIEKFKTATESGSSTETSQDPQAQITVMLYNGTTQGNALDGVGKILSDRFPKVSVIGRQKANRQDYTETMVIDLSGSNSDLARLLAQALGGTVVPHTLEGEVIPNTDLEIMVGSSEQ